jgi:hypothetical protein
MEISSSNLGTLIGLGYCALDGSLEGWISRVEAREVGQLLFRLRAKVPELAKRTSREDVLWTLEKMSDLEREHLFRSNLAVRFYVGELARKFPPSSATVTAFCAIRHPDELVAQDALSGYSAVATKIYEASGKSYDLNELIGQLAALEDAVF